jgi:hypothetical protein
MTMLLTFSACTSPDSASAQAATSDGVPIANATDSESATAGALTAAPSLVPSATFALADDEKVTGVAMSPDGTRIAVSSQTQLGRPVTLRTYNAATGAVEATATVKTVGLWQLHWMSDNRLVSADRDARLQWRVWDGTTLAEQLPMKQDPTCADGQVNRTTGAVYSTDGVATMGKVICRFDTRTGAMTRTAAGLLVKPERFWVRAASGEVVVLHSPNPDVSMELVTLDGASLTKASAVPVSFGDDVLAVGKTAWIANNNNRTARLEPGALAVPYLSPIRASTAGTVFVHSNGMDDFVFLSATDGMVIGTMPAGMNLGPFASWSNDDAVFVRLTVDEQVEVYRF